MGYLHGITVKEGEKPVILASGDTVIAVVGTASKGDTNSAKLVTSKKQAKELFGDNIGGFTLPGALEIIFTHAKVKVIAINVLTTAEATALITSGKMTKDEHGNWASNIGKKTLPSAVDFTSKITAGIELLNIAETDFGLKPNVIIAPGYSQVVAVMNKLDDISAKLNATAICDIAADSVTAALTERNSTYNLSKTNVIYTFPELMYYNEHESEQQPFALSAFEAAGKAARDAETGFWNSPSNYQLTGVTGMSVKITASLQDSTADTNLLNAQGIVTVLRLAKSGYRLWGNWTSAFPATELSDAMISCSAVKQNITEALFSGALKFADKTITPLVIDLILDTVNAHLRNMVGKGVIIAGECIVDKDDNPPQEVAKGKLSFKNIITYAPSLEQITFEQVVDIDKLKSIF
ncbi:MAG: phage tail sheath subtilisin-like domain-containing protein [Bacteroidales bacterium]|jgi:phage tail sheath protein FI|nr:phage tail sheath subtilisin-like domain-containing protein [Bacteroidales bacterium]